MNGHEFLASGNGHEVTQQFQKFLDLIAELNTREAGQGKSTASSTPISAQTHVSQPAPTHASLQQVFDSDYRSPALIYRLPPHNAENLADVTLMLLLGYHELRQMHEVPATALNQALLRSSLKISRLDRVLKSYIRERFIVKRGRGKGGYYRLTDLGIPKATEKIRKYAALLPSAGHLDHVL
ncbi:MAG: hypothetical protein NPIRA05_09800 [Nitrospirales bacterium]|nr:MAG: hypothetical protein NPIRA05_09800 [Nitrospirales bacterium]